jgi:two-component system, sporulation sensor kinase D
LPTQSSPSMRRRNFPLYIIIVIVPILLFSAVYLHVKAKHALSLLESNALSYAGFHAMYIENFFGETIGRLESMAVFLDSQEEKPEVIDKVLGETHNKDPRFSGFYLVNRTGDIINSTNRLSGKVNLADRLYFQRAIQTGETQISEAHIGRVTGRFIFSVATPILDHEGEVQSVLIGSVQLEEMNNIIRKMVRTEMVQIIDQSGNILLQTEQIPAGVQIATSTVMLEAVPWKINSMMIFDEKESVFKPLLVQLAIGFVVLNVIFLLVKQLLLRREMAQELERLEADKLKLVGLIAASTAHEIRNPLTGIKGFITLLSEKYKEDRDKYYFSLIQTEVDRINNIVGELLIVGKPTVASTDIIHVNEVLKEMGPLIESEANLYNVQLSIQMTREAAYVRISKDHFKQVYLNLVKNALESMESGGQLSIVSERAGERVLLKLKDTGKGMSPEILKKLFVPFFTMKRNGTGLGLMVCKRILDSYGVTLHIESKEGNGTEVTIQFPAQEDS